MPNCHWPSGRFHRFAPLLLAASLTSSCALFVTPAPCPVCPPATTLPGELPPVPSLAATPTLVPAAWAELPGWADDDLVDAWAAFRQSCASGRWQANPAALPPAGGAPVPAGGPPAPAGGAPAPTGGASAPMGAAPGPANGQARTPAAGANGLAAARHDWAAVCRAAEPLAAGGKVGAPALRAFFERWLAPWSLVNGDGSREGMITGYYEPLLAGSRRPGGAFTVPIHAVPDDLLTIELGDLFPELKGKRVRGRLEGRRVVPYHDRAGLRGRAAELRDKVLVWAADPVEVFFLHIQGSGRVRLPDGSLLRVGYADQNGHPYQSIGRLLVERGELALEQASMQGIQAWARANPAKLEALLDANPSYVFFRELPSGDGGPLGALGVPLTERRSLAVDPAFIPLGAPVFLATTQPNSTQPLNRLMFAQDTGGAIKGGVRGDFFWGFGAEAGQLAGRMRQSGRMWVLLPRSPEIAELPPLDRDQARR
jgi:membrane-bound lytic murein transglycosylase A